MNSKNARLVTACWSLSLLVVVLLVWEYGPGWLGVPDFVLPNFSKVCAEAARIWSSERLFWHAGITAMEVVVGFVLGSILLILLAPLLLVVMLLIKLDSPGPVIFSQDRLGFNNRSFKIYKFRSMTHVETVPDKTVQATMNDARVTRIGRILRKTSIDELPQLLNVLNGTMSLVGPRPHAIDHNEEYATKIRGYFSRHRVKPGITGLAQVKGYRGITDTLSKMEGRVKYDLEYADSWSLLLDVKILILTIFTAFRGTNAF